MKKEKAKFDLVEPNKQWEMWLTNKVEETGVDNCGLFVEANSEKEAIEKFKSLIKVIQEAGKELI